MSLLKKVSKLSSTELDICIQELAKELLKSISITHNIRNIAKQFSKKAIKSREDDVNNIAKISEDTTSLEPMSLSKESIDLFYSVSKKKENDAHNKLREDILCDMLNNKIPNEWLSDSKWDKLQTSLKEYVSKIVYPSEKLINAERKSGRGHNHDFLFKVQESEQKIKEIKVEFKYNSENISQYPEFLSVSSAWFSKENTITYAEFYYENYLQKVVKLFESIDEEIPTKAQYMKYIYQNYYTKHPIFQAMYEQEEPILKQKKKLVDESICDYLTNHFQLDIDKLNTKLKESQDNKQFMLYKNGAFYHDCIREEELSIVKIKSIKLGNTVICETKAEKTDIHMLLRWKNHAGILFPAWQIKLVRNK